MATTLTSTGITFPDATVQTTAAATSTYAKYGYQLFTASGTFTVPTGVTAIKVTVLGGGAAGYHHSGAAGNSGGNSSFGAYCSANGGTASTGGTATGGTFINLKGEVGVSWVGGSTPYGSGGQSTITATYSTGVAGTGYGSGGGPSIYSSSPGVNGGSAGGTATKHIAGLAPGSTVTVTVGAGGVATAPYGVYNGAGATGMVLVEW